MGFAGLQTCTICNGCCTPSPPPWQVFGEMVMEGVLSPDWKSREMAVTHTSREVVSLLLPQIKATNVSMETGAEWREVHEAAFLIIVNGCSDSVLKVFLASLVSPFLSLLSPSSSESFSFLLSRNIRSRGNVCGPRNTQWKPSLLK